MNRTSFKFGILAFAAITPVVFAACNKEATPSPSQGQTLDQRIAELNELTNYHSPIAGEIRDNHFWAGCLTADLGGAWAGIELAAKYGGADPPMAFALGLVGGAAVGSGYYYWQNGYPTHPIGTVPVDLKDAAPGFARTYTDTIEKLGYYHNHYVLSMFKKGQVMASTIPGMNAQWGPILSKSMSHDLGMDTIFYLSIWNDPTYVARLCKPLPSVYSVAVDSLASYAQNPHDVRPWLDSLYSHIYNLTDANLHYASDYAVTYSAKVKLASGLTANDKAYLLDGFSVCRYSAALWSANE